MQKRRDKIRKMRFVYSIQMRYGDFDTQCFVNHSKICSYIELAYLSFFTERIFVKWDFSHVPILLKAESTEFIKPIQKDAKPICSVEVVEVRSKGVQLKIIVEDRRRTKLTYAIAYRTLIYVDLKSIHPILFTNKTLTLLKRNLIDT